MADDLYEVEYLPPQGWFKGGWVITWWAYWDTVQFGPYPSEEEARNALKIIREFNRD